MDEKIARLFQGWEETMIWSCLQGHMGYAITDGRETPAAAQIVVGDFCFFAGNPDKALIRRAAAPIVTPQNEDWCRAIEEELGEKAQKALRYAIRKEPDVFDRKKLKGYTEALPEGFCLRRIDESLYDALMGEEWSGEFCSQFLGAEDFVNRGLGIVALYQGKPVAGASSYTIYTGGIEIEIDTRPDFRRMGLALACGAKLILECLDRGWYPSWDAHDLRSVALAEKLGYHMDGPYPVYFI